jgi:hypothetical protein
MTMMGAKGVSKIFFNFACDVIFEHHLRPVFFNLFKVAEPLKQHQAFGGTLTLKIRRANLRNED